MKSLVIMSYAQPLHSVSGLVFGVVTQKRDTKEQPVRWSKYRMFDEMFKRTRMLWTLRTLKGVRQFYVARSNWKIVIPFVGSLLLPLFKLFGKKSS